MFLCPPHLVAIEIHHVSSLQHKQSCLLDLQTGQSNVCLDGALSCQWLAKRLTGFCLYVDYENMIVKLW